MIRIIILPILLLLFLGSAFLLPERGEFATASIRKAPLFFGDWTGEKEIPSEKELKTLSDDTIFEKGTYADYEMPPLRTPDGQLIRSGINLSIVKSGHDMNNSIHRPERCLTAQGHLDLLATKSQTTTPKGQTLPLTRIITRYPWYQKGNEAPSGNFGFISYYYFVGSHRLTNSHTSRNLIDIQDRLIKGTDQQWSFVIQSMPYELTDDLEKNQKNLEAADQKIRQFVAQLADEIIKFDEIKN